jgi:hypothetical protein
MYLFASFSERVDQLVAVGPQLDGHRLDWGGGEKCGTARSSLDIAGVVAAFQKTCPGDALIEIRFVRGSHRGRSSGRISAGCRRWPRETKSRSRRRRFLGSFGRSSRETAGQPDGRNGDVRRFQPLWRLQPLVISACGQQRRRPTCVNPPFAATYADLKPRRRETAGIRVRTDRVPGRDSNSPPLFNSPLNRAEVRVDSNFDPRKSGR